MHSKVDEIIALSFDSEQHGDVTNRFFEPNRLGSLASARLQLLPALKNAKALQLKTKIFSLHKPEEKLFTNTTGRRVCIIGKMSAKKDALIDRMIEANLTTIRTLKASGATIVVLHSDNTIHPGDALSEFYSEILEIADATIYPSESLKRITCNYTRPKCSQYVIYDPWQLQKQHQPRALEPNSNLRIIWFGSNKNIRYLLMHLEDLFKRSQPINPCELTVLAQPWGIKQVKKFIHSLDGRSPRWNMRLIYWKANNQPQQLEEEISRAHICIIPSDTHSPLKAGVSHNRMVDSIRGGCITIATPLHSYKRFGEVAILSNNLPEALKTSLKNYDRLCENLIIKRPKLLSPFSPTKNNLDWISFWKDTLKVHAS